MKLCHEYLPYAPGVGRHCSREATETVDALDYCRTHARTRRRLLALASLVAGLPLGPAGVDWAEARPRRRGAYRRGEVRA